MCHDFRDYHIIPGCCVQYPRNSMWYDFRDQQHILIWYVLYAEVDVYRLPLLSKLHLMTTPLYLLFLECKLSCLTLLN